MSLWTNFKFFTDALSYCSTGRHMIPKCISRQNEIPVVNIKNRERGPLQYYSRNMKRTFRPFHSLRPQKEMSENVIYCSTQTAASEAVVVFLELLMHVKCIRLNVRINEFSLIHLGETFTLAEWREIYNTRSRAIKE